MAKTLFLVPFLVVVLFCYNSWAEDLSARSWDKRFTLYGGGMAYIMDGTFSSTKEGQPDYDVDLDDLGLDEHKFSYFLGATLRVKERFRLRFDYFRYHDKANTTVDEEFEFDGEIFPAGARIDSKLHLDLYVINLIYNLYQSERASFGIGVGAHVADLDLRVSGTGGVDGIGNADAEGKSDIFAPLPNLSAGGGYAFSDDIFLRYGGGWMSMSYDDYDGDLLFLRSYLEYWPYKHMGLGVGYSYLSADIDYDPGHKKEKYDIDMYGPTAYLTIGF